MVSLAIQFIKTIFKVFEREVDWYKSLRYTSEIVQLLAFIHSLSVLLLQRIGVDATGEKTDMSLLRHNPVLTYNFTSTLTA